MAGGKKNRPENSWNGYIYNAKGERVDFLELVTDGVKTISNEEYGIHEGKGFTTNKYWQGVSGDDVNNIAITAPADKYLHIKLTTPFTTGQYGKLQIQRGASISGGTTVNNIPNRNGDDDAQFAEASLKYDVTIDTSGEDIYKPDPILFGSATEQKTGPIGVRHEDLDLIIQPGDTAVFILTNNAGQSVDFIGIGLVWYEADEGYTGG